MSLNFQSALDKTTDSAFIKTAALSGQLETFPLSAVRPNPYRKLDKYPLNEDRIAVLVESIEKTGFWPVLLARRCSGGVELAFGHHRYEAARRLGFAEIELIVVDLSDDEMFFIMAEENASQRGNSPEHTDLIVESARDFLESQLPDPSEYVLVEPPGGNLDRQPTLKHPTYSDVRQEVERRKEKEEIEWPRRDVQAINTSSNSSRYVDTFDAIDLFGYRALEFVNGDTRNGVTWAIIQVFLNKKKEMEAASWPKTRLQDSLARISQHSPSRFLTALKGRYEALVAEREAEMSKREAKVQRRKDAVGAFRRSLNALSLSPTLLQHLTEEEQGTYTAVLEAVSKHLSWANVEEAKDKDASAINFPDLSDLQATVGALREEVTARLDAEAKAKLVEEQRQKTINGNLTAARTYKRELEALLSASSQMLQEAAPYWETYSAIIRCTEDNFEMENVALVEKAIEDVETYLDADEASHEHPVVRYCNIAQKTAELKDFRIRVKQAEVQAKADAEAARWSGEAPRVFEEAASAKEFHEALKELDKVGLLPSPDEQLALAKKIRSSLRASDEPVSKVIPVSVRDAARALAGSGLDISSDADWPQYKLTVNNVHARVVELRMSAVHRELVRDGKLIEDAYWLFPTLDARQAFVGLVASGDFKDILAPEFQVANALMARTKITGDDPRSAMSVSMSGDLLRKFFRDGGKGQEDVAKKASVDLVDKESRAFVEALGKATGALKRIIRTTEDAGSDFVTLSVGRSARDEAYVVFKDAMQRYTDLLVYSKRLFDEAPGVQPVVNEVRFLTKR